MPLSNKEIETTLNKFGKRLVQASRSSLTQQKINASGDLYKSIGYDLIVSPNSFQFSFGSGLDYAEYQDRGVSGKERKFKTPFSYKTKKPPASVFINWAKQKGIKPRNKTTGRFTTLKSFGFAMSNHVFKQGIRPKEFITRPFENAFKALPDELVEAYGLSLDRSLLR